MLVSHIVESSLYLKWLYILCSNLLNLLFLNSCCLFLFWLGFCLTGVVVSGPSVGVSDPGCGRWWTLQQKCCVSIALWTQHSWEHQPCVRAHCGQGAPHCATIMFGGRYMWLLWGDTFRMCNPWWPGQLRRGSKMSMQIWTSWST